MITFISYLLSFILLFFFRLLLRHADEDGAQHCEYVCLDVGYQTLQSGHEHHHEDGNDRGGGTQASAVHAADDKNQGHEHHDDDVACQDVGKQTDHQGEGLGKGGDELYDRHQGDGELQEHRHVGPEDVLPIMSVTEDVDRHVGAEGQYQGNAQVACDVGAEGEEGNQPEEVAEEDEEEHRQQVRRELWHLALWDGGADDAVKHHVGEPFHQTLVFGGGTHWVFLVFLGRR